MCLPFLHPNPSMQKQVTSEDQELTHGNTCGDMTEKKSEKNEKVASLKSGIVNFELALL